MGNGFFIYKGDMMILRNISIFLLIVFLLSLYAQGSYKISGRVIDELTKQPLVGSNISIANTSIGTSSDDNGLFTIKILPQGFYLLEVSYMGYSIKPYEIPFLEADTTLIIELSQSTISGPMVVVESNRAQERVSPVTFSNIDRNAIQSRYTVQDIPEILSELPSTTFLSFMTVGL